MSRKCITCGTPPQPYYTDQNNSLTQDHAAIFEDTKFAAGIQIGEEFVVPAFGTDTQLCAKNLTNVVLGAYVWNPAYGYLKIVHWDSCLRKIGLLNEDISGAAIPGTVVSEGTLFTVSPRPCCADQDNFQYLPFLAEDYVIPAVSASVTLAVTSTYGLIEGTNIRIGSNVYFLDQINSSLEIVVTNEGVGGTPGTTVDARDVNGNLQYLITQAVVSPCTGTGADTGKIVACDGANQTVLEGEYAGQVPVLQDASTQEVTYQFLDAGVRVCTFLTSVFNVLSATPSYTIDVDDESVFSIGQVLEIQGVDLRWEITDNTTPGELDITCTTGNPGVTVALPIGSYVCLQYCCETLTNEINRQALEGWATISNSAFYIAADNFEVVGDVTAYLYAGQKIKLLIGGTPFYGNVASFFYGLTPGRTRISVIANLSYVLSAGTLTDFQVCNGEAPDFPAYFSYDCNPGGFSSISSEVAVYWVNGTSITGRVIIEGISNSVNFTFDIPIASELSGLFSLAAISAQGYSMVDNGSGLTTVGKVLYTAFPTVNLYIDQTSATWTSTGDKSAVIDFNYPIAQ